MALPADGSPMLEGHPDKGKDHGKVWLNEADIVSEDHGEELRYSSPPQYMDCSTSSSGSNTTSSSEDEVGNDCTTSSDKDEVDNEDQDDFKSQLRVVQVLRPNIKFLWGIGVLEQSLKHVNLMVDQLCSADSSLTMDRADVASQLLEILPQNFKYIQDIRVAQKPQEDTAPCTSLEFTSGLDKQEEPILHPEKSRPIATSQHHQVGLEEDGSSLTSGHTRNITQKVDAVKEDDPSSKLSFGTVLPSSFTFTFGLDKEEEPILHSQDSKPISTSQYHQEGLKEDGASLTSGRARITTKKVDAAKEDDPTLKLSFGTVLSSLFIFTSGLDKKQEPNPEDFSPICTSPQPLGGWKNLVASLTFGCANRTTKMVDATKEDDPKPSHQIGLKEDAAHVTSVTDINGKRTKDSDAEDQPPAKRTRDTVAEEELPTKRTKDNDDAKQEPSARRFRENQADDELPSKRTRDTVAKEEPPTKRTKGSVAEEESPAKRTKYSDNASWDEVLQRIGRRLAWRYGKEWEDEPIPSTPLFIPYQKTEYEDPILLSLVLSPSPRTSCEDPGLSSPVLSPLRGMVHEDPFFSSPDLSPSPLTHCEDPILLPRVFSPSPSTHCENPTVSSPDFCFWVESEGVIEEEPTPSTSGGITETVSSRHVWFRPRYVLSSDSD
ncbi:uncharacterized protein LOC107837129 [Poecilia formosa]|uniref:uncharacterized protein LOC107837129 n=1 Tax=Poecilia formosa TaxID=48698 RepID=UPI0007B87DF1|nr:PREDICTED: uncharacterized protein LOC107837129 [Poecilia formosa]